MLSKVKTALDGVLGAATTLKNANGAGRIFELYVMSLIARELQLRGCDVVLQRSDETQIAPGDLDRRFIQRGGKPTGVPAKSMGADHGTSIVITTPVHKKIWEIWNGVQFQGRSKALHELDLAIVPREVAVAVRANGGFPYGKPRVAIECKDVDAKGSLDETRAFLARLYDLTIIESHPHHPGSGPKHNIYTGPAPGQPSGLPGEPIHQSPPNFFLENQRSLNAIARTTGFTGGVPLLLSYYRIAPHGEIQVGNTRGQDLARIVADWILKHLDA